MEVITTSIEGVFIIEPDIFEDHRGFFMETWNRKRFHDAGLDVEFVQDNLSYSEYGVLRGLHFQNPHTQSKFVNVLHGEIFDVAVDIRIGSPTFGKWEGVLLSADNKRQYYIPDGFAHGFCVLSSSALVLYKCTDFYEPFAEKGILWNDPEIAINWPINDPIMSLKDKSCSLLKDLDESVLPVFRRQI